MASLFPVACLQAHHQIEEFFALLEGAFGLVRAAHRVAYALPIHWQLIA
ncbi:MAG: hypothetical protein HY268_25020 [Deltaproteobacteria bacterium]|nr:hypothetical protein [Deltaproteobacteria bacterium]